MNAPYDMLYKIAQDREDDIRRGSYLSRNAQSAPLRRGRVQGRVAGVLRSLADRLDPAHANGQFSRRATAE
jgi:hypothetical protein